MNDETKLQQSFVTNDISCTHSIAVCGVCRFLFIYIYEVDLRNGCLSFEMLGKYANLPPFQMTSGNIIYNVISRHFVNANKRQICHRIATISVNHHSLMLMLVSLSIIINNRMVSAAVLSQVHPDRVDQSEYRLKSVKFGYVHDGYL
jgi:hypothetical protein